MQPSIDSDPYNLDRFLKAQEPVFESIELELREGQKVSHWMWFVFPQVDGLGSSETARYFAVRSTDEARAYLDHPLLGRRLQRCADLLLAHGNRTANEILGFPDDLKLQSSMTLFAAIAGPESNFQRVLDLFFEGNRDERTLVLLNLAA